jgi:hypothetical protein
LVGAVRGGSILLRFDHFFRFSKKKTENSLLFITEKAKGKKRENQTDDESLAGAAGCLDELQQQQYNAVAPQQSRWVHLRGVIIVARHRCRQAELPPHRQREGLNLGN